jgi:hypothetical protein
MPPSDATIDASGYAPDHPCGGSSSGLQGFSPDAPPERVNVTVARVAGEGEAPQVGLHVTPGRSGRWLDEIGLDASRASCVPENALRAGFRRGAIVTSPGGVSDA